MKLWKTGQIAPVTGIYQFVRYADPGPPYPKPTRDEQEIPLDEGDRFPPIASTGRSAWYKRKR